tara:strand:- start:155 stop:286 length:132 start_codon:yes stop_codon:yes gene_type:complete
LFFFFFDVVFTTKTVLFSLFSVFCPLKKGGKDDEAKKKENFEN